MQLSAAQQGLFAPALATCRRLLSAHRGRAAMQLSCSSRRRPLGLPALHHRASHGGQRARAATVVVLASAASTDGNVGDEAKEQSRKYMRSVFDPDRWEKHRGTGRYVRHIVGIIDSNLITGMAPALLYVTTVAIAVCLYETARQAGTLPPVFPDLQFRSKEVFAFTSFAFALLLSYRTNASYERWDGARKMWGLVLNRSRDIVKLGLAWIPREKAELRTMLCRWVPAFSKSLMCHLRKGEDLAKELDGILYPHEIAAVMKATHRPNYVLQVLAQIVKEAQLPTAPTVEMEADLTVFEDCLGGCERILRTPIPQNYTRHTSRFLMIWLTLLPASLFPTCEWNTVWLSAVIAFLLMGIEEIGVSIEEPFGVLALEAISNTALVNVRELEATNDKSGTSTGDFGGAASAGSDAVPAEQIVALAQALDDSKERYFFWQ